MKRLALPSLLLLAACTGGEEGPTGPAAETVLARDFDQPAHTDVGAAMRMLAASERERRGARTDDDVALAGRFIDFLQKNQGARIAFEPKSYKLLDFGFQEPQALRSRASALTGVENFLISTADRMPVRDQGQRGTCASFAGVGALESFLLKKYPHVPALDLAEQLFYFASKPECQSGRCGENDQGSLTHAGFEASITGAYDVATEASCTYRSRFGPDDVQASYTKSSCLDGHVARITAIDYVESAQEILDLVMEEDVAVVVYSRLSDNWMRGEEIITLAEAGPATGMHAGGHAYLVVGARRIDIPGEGGMCFVIKNSWGQGWGQEGYACMTLAWFEEWRYQVPFPVIRDAKLTPEFLARYDGLAPAPTPTPAPEPPQPPGPTPLPDLNDWVPALLAAENHAFYRVEHAASGGRYQLRGILADGGTTETLELRIAADDTLLHDGIAVGRAYDGQVHLCSLAFRDTCQLSWFEEENALAVEFLPYVKEAAAFEETLASAASGDWIGLLPLAGFDLQVLPSLEGVGLRAVQDGQPLGEALGFVLDPLNGNIVHRGKQVGAVSSGGVDLCTGAYSDRCSLKIGPTGPKLFVR